MKLKVLFLIPVFCLIAGFMNTVSAQDNLKALLLKCESMDDVSINIVHQRDRETKETTQIVKSFSFKNNKSLVDDFLKAFEKDKDEAIQVIENKKNGKIVPSYYQFADGEYNVAYTINVKDDGTSANISVIQNRVGKSKLGKWNY